MGNSNYSTGFGHVYDYWVLGPLGHGLGLKLRNVKAGPVEGYGAFVGFLLWGLCCFCLRLEICQPGFRGRGGAVSLGKG